MVPSNRLLLLATLYIPVALAAAFNSTMWVVGGVVLVVLGGLAVADALGSLWQFTGVEIESPKIVRLSKKGKATIELKIKSAKRTFKRLRCGLPLPETIKADQDEFLMQIPKKDRWYRLQWMVEPTECGPYSLQTVCLETPSQLGLWLVRGTVPVESELRVYPNLRRELKSAAALFLNRGDNGSHVWRQVSKGREFEKLREYIPGDTYQDIHWKTTAKRQHPVTKVYQIERTQEIYVVLDSSRLSARRVKMPGSDETVTMLERYISSALMLAVAAEKQGDLFGLVEFGARPNLYLKAARGIAHFDTCRNALYTLLPEEASPNFNELVSFIRTRLRKRALLVFLTNLDDAAEAERFKESISLLSHHHLVVVNMLKPEGANPLFEGEAVESVSDLYERLSGHISWRKLHELELHLRTEGVQLSLLDNECLSGNLITQYMQIKQRQLL